MLALWIGLAGFCLCFVAIVVVMRMLTWLQAAQFRRRRIELVRCQLPATMELLAMLLSAGLPLVSALQQLLRRNTSSAMDQELNLVLAAIRTGDSMVTAIQRLRTRNPSAEMSMFATMIIQSSQQGGALAPLLTEQASAFRQALAEDIEQRAQELPVRLLMPLIIFVFPATMLPFIGVIVAKVLWPS
ncbi:MAG: type II secretion system F family protein [Aliidiomarina sp.]|uniref:type II secretion system F family protein n=1 Tax=Aliidiomarina sp. TaxID=1872439 RepID=UPI0025B88DEE|nr:type II secretion system F family protein [Aliidiomarina sp.]MCH8502075.1 type II secretion system F family protein [Aliidiomarina sp.]